jgi:AcrR family transcriptional regulator
MRKGEQTRAAIVAAALDLAAGDSLEGLTIGLIARRLQMSKAGVFAHFGSREELQIAVLKEYERRFIEDVLLPSLKEPRGLPRLEAMYSRWLDRGRTEIESGCVFISGAVEYDDRPGPIRDLLVSMIRSWQRELMRAIKQAIDVGHLRPETDPQQLVFAMYGLILALHHDGRLMHSKDSVVRCRDGFAQLVDPLRTSAPKAATTPRHRKSIKEKSNGTVRRPSP